MCASPRLLHSFLFVIFQLESWNRIYLFIYEYAIISHKHVLVNKRDENCDWLPNYFRQVSYHVTIKAFINKYLSMKHKQNNKTSTLHSSFFLRRTCWQKCFDKSCCWMKQGAFSVAFKKFSHASMNFIPNFRKSFQWMRLERRQSFSSLIK